MLNKTLIGERFKMVRDTWGLNQYKFADLIKTKQSYISRYEAGKLEIQDDVKYELSKRGININWLLTGDGDMFLTDKSVIIPPNGDKATIPVGGNATSQPLTEPKNGKESPFLKILTREEMPEDGFIIPFFNQEVSAGNGKEGVEEEGKVLITAPGWLAKYGKHLSALKVTGDSMKPTIENGDVVICDTTGWNGEGVYIIRNSNDYFVKRISKHQGQFVILSDNKNYPPLLTSMKEDDVVVIGKVRCVIRRWE